MPRFPEFISCLIFASGQFFTRLAQKADTQTINFTRNLQAAFRQTASRKRIITNTRGTEVVKIFKDKKENKNMEINNELPKKRIFIRIIMGITKVTGHGQNINALGKRNTMNVAFVRVAFKALVLRLAAKVKR